MTARLDAACLFDDVPEVPLASTWQVTTCGQCGVVRGCRPVEGGSCGRAFRDTRGKTVVKTWRGPTVMRCLACAPWRKP